MKTCSFALLAIAASAIVTAPATAGVESFYKGNRIAHIVGYDAGSPFDIYARLLTRHMGKYIPGNPGFVVQNMPGAGSLTAANHLYNVAPRDGTAMGNFHGNIGVEPRIQNRGVRYEGRRFTWIGSMAKQNLVCVTWHTSGAKTMQDLREKLIIAGGIGGAAGSSVLYPRVMNAVAGTKFKLITGYTENDLDLALERGEVHSRCGIGWASLKAKYAEWLDKKHIYLPVQMSLTAHPELAEVPLLMDFVEREEDKQTLEVLFAPQEAGRPFAAPPDIPADRTQALRDAFDAALKDPALLGEAERARVEIDPISGRQIDAMLDRLYALPDAPFQRILEFRKPTSVETKR